MTHITVSGKVEPQLKKLLARAADKRKSSNSKMLRHILLENIQKYTELTPTENRYITEKQQEHQEQMYSYLARRKRQEATYQHYIKKRLAQMYIRGADYTSMIEYIEECEPVADMRDVSLEEIKQTVQNGGMHTILEDVRDTNLELDKLAGAPLEKGLEDED